MNNKAGFHLVDGSFFIGENLIQDGDIKKFQGPVHFSTDFENWRTINSPYNLYVDSIIAEFDVNSISQQTLNG